MHIQPRTSPFDRVLWLALAAGALGFVFGGCAGSTVRPDDLSAENHRRVAERESSLAAAESARYDARQRVTSHAQPAGLPAPTDYNPTERHLYAAAEHAAHAKQHLAAAAELERFESSACTGVAVSERAACPVLSPVAAISDIEGGVRVQPAEVVRVVTLLARMRCHLAYARSRAFTTAPDCPLYMRGVEIRASADGRAVELIARDPKTIDELRRRVRAEASTSTAL